MYNTGVFCCHADRNTTAVISAVLDLVLLTMSDYYIYNDQVDTSQYNCIMSLMMMSSLIEGRSMSIGVLLDWDWNGDWV